MIDKRRLPARGVAQPALADTVKSLAELGLALLISVALPYLLRIWTLPLGLHEPEARHSAMAAAAAVVPGYWLQRNMGRLPGARALSGILTAQIVAFGVVTVIVLLARVSYSRTILGVSFVLAVAWFTLVGSLARPRRPLRLGVVSGGHVASLVALPGLDCRVLALDDWPGDVDAVAADFRFDHGDAWDVRLADYVLAGIAVYHSKDLHESLTGRADLEHLSENTFGVLGPQTALLLAKQVLDFALALVALVAMAPLMLLIALAVRLDSRGPALFVQQRVGYRGRPFTLLKFRTMHSPAVPASSDILTAITQPDDWRITRVGALLRRSRLDELPQIINILRGQMSWIGPRPEAVALSAWYQAEIPFYRYRHVVRPGISGWAQVNQGHVHGVDDVRRKLQFDFYYIRNFSVWLDLLIVIRTLQTMLTGFGHR